MSPNLLESQLATLEVPTGTDAIAIVNDRVPALIVDEILAHVQRSARV